MLKKSLFFVLFAMGPGIAYAACVANPISYTACKAGYYLENGQCLPCPDGGTSADRNKTGKTACYLPSGTQKSDSTGDFQYTANCNYSN